MSSIILYFENSEIRQAIQRAIKYVLNGECSVFLPKTPGEIKDTLMNNLKSHILVDDEKDSLASIHYIYNNYRDIINDCFIIGLPCKSADLQFKCSISISEIFRLKGVKDNLQENEYLFGKLRNGMLHTFRGVNENNFFAESKILLRKLKEIWHQQGFDKHEIGKPEREVIGKLINYLEKNNFEKSVSLINKIVKHDWGEAFKFISSDNKGSDLIDVREVLPLIKIKIVDDSEDSCKNILEYLNNLIAADRELPFQLTMNYDIISSESIAAQLSNFLDHQLLDPELKVIIMDYDLGSINVRNGKQSDIYKGSEWARLIKDIRPDIDVFLITHHDPMPIVGEYYKYFTRPFQKGEKAELENLYKAIRNSIISKSETPFFNALKNFSKEAFDYFHTLAISGGKSLSKSGWTKEFFEFYGRNYFYAENAATIETMDSLLDPKGNIKKAQELAAKAFGSRRTFFVTNGTSTSNKIVLQALINPGDVILIDRNCHKSHHYGMILAGGLPYYLEPYSLDKYGISGGIPLEEITKNLKQLLNNEIIPKAILLTNCTFDGIVTNPYIIISEVYNILREKSIPLNKIVFIFDEAWFAYAYADKDLRERSAMYTAEKWNSEYKEDYVRIYSTQSTHKTLTSFRQGSMIHVYDYLLEQDNYLEHRFKEAIYTHSTTSPNYGIIASLDVGRAQFQIEGYRLLREAISLAAKLKETINNDNNLKNIFSILDKKDLIPQEYQDFFSLDKTKLTLCIKKQYSGSEFQRVFHKDYNIQFNKTSQNTALLMTNIGSTSSSIAHLFDSLLKEADKLRMKLLIDEKSNKNKKEDKFIPLPKFKGFINNNHNLREHFYLSEDKLERVDINTISISNEYPIYSATFVIPYPPGYPILVPGQLVDADTINFLKNLKSREIHGMPDGKTLYVFSNKVF